MFLDVEGTRLRSANGRGAPGRLLLCKGGTTVCGGYFQPTTTLHREVACEGEGLLPEGIEQRLVVKILVRSSYVRANCRNVRNGNTTSSSSSTRRMESSPALGACWKYVRKSMLVHGNSRTTLRCEIGEAARTTSKWMTRCWVDARTEHSVASKLVATVHEGNHEQSSGMAVHHCAG